MLHSQQKALQFPCPLILENQKQERNLEKEKGKNYWTEIQQEASHQQSSTRPEPYLGVEATVWEDDKSSLYDNFIFSRSFLLGCFL